MTAGKLARVIVSGVAIVVVVGTVHWRGGAERGSGGSGAGASPRAATQVQGALLAGASHGVAAGRDRDLVLVPAAAQVGTSKAIHVSMSIPAGATTGKDSTSSWQNTSFTAQTGMFRAEFDVIPRDAGMDGVVALSTGAGSSYNDFAALVRFNSDNAIDARNGGAYAAVEEVRYTPGKNHRVRMEVNVPAGTYSAYVTPQGGSEQVVARDYVFRNEQAGVSSLANWGIIAGIGSLRAGNFTITPRAMPLAADAGADRAIVVGQSCTLSGAGSGGTAPYTYAWSPAEGLSSTSIANPLASPSATTVYTLTVTDQMGQKAAADVTVVVMPPTSGPTFYVDKAAGEDTNPGSMAAPWKTLAKAVSAVTAGATVIVRPGVYYESLALNKSGVAGSPIVFRSETVRGAVLDGQGTRSNGINVDGRQHIRVEGFEVRNHTANGIVAQSFYGTSAEGIEVVNNYIHHNGNYTTWGGSGVGILACNLRNSLIDGNEIYYNGESAITINGNNYQQANLTIRGNTIHYNGRDGITGGGTNIIIEYNHFYDQEHTVLHQDGIELWCANGVIVRYNILGDFTQMVYGGMNGGVTHSFVNLQVYGNIFYNSLRWKRRGYNVAAVWIDCRNANMNNTFGHIEVHSNTFLFLGSKQVPIQLQGADGLVMDDVRAYNNIFYQCGGAEGANAYWIDTRFTNVRADYNCFYGVTKNLAGQDAHSITADPRFVNYTQVEVPVDVRLLSGSPCLNTGPATLPSLVTLPTVFVDRDNKTRPSGGNYEMGAYEY